jgi:hypothetical protein
MTGGWTHIEQVCTGAVVTLLPHIWPRRPSHSSSQGDSGDEEGEEGEEAAHQEEETATSLVGCGRLVEEERE